MTKATGNKRGRPPKAEIQAIKENRPVGRPKGTAAVINEYRDRMLASPKSAKVLETIMNAALTDGHPNQAAAWKIVADRIVPVSAFDTTKQAGGVPQISINISSVGAPKVERLDDIIDVEGRDES
jgi:hypothetical protein